MNHVAIIPLRAGSKGIKHKNKLKFAGRPLFCWVLGEAIFSNLNVIYVYTDDEEIKQYIHSQYNWTDKVKVMDRSEESASDTASTEFAMLEVADNIDYNFDTLTLLQATSPLTTREDINGVLGKVATGECDSALSVVRTHRFIWSEEGESLNYDYLNRPRRQDFNGMLMENGAVYSCSKDSFIKTKNRLGGKIGIFEMCEDTLVELDERHDIFTIEQLIFNRLKKQKGAGKEVKAAVFDVDGVFTDGKVGFSKEGELFKTFSLIDGMGLEILRNHGVIPVVMTSENSPLVEQRMKKLKIDHFYPGVKDKYSFLETILSELGLDRSEVAYTGDDVNDLANICSCGWGICPNNAVNEVTSKADVILDTHSGKEVVRNSVRFITNFNKRFN